MVLVVSSCVNPITCILVSCWYLQPSEYNAPTWQTDGRTGTWWQKNRAYT